MAESSNGLTLQPLREDQYKQVAEWAHGPQENADWEDYAAYMNDPKRRNLGIYLATEFVGCIFLELTDPNTVEYHIATARKKIHPQSLAQALLDTAGGLFAAGCTSLVARIPRQTRAAVRLAIRCGMREWGHTPEMRYFILTKQRYERHAQ